MEILSILILREFFHQKLSDNYAMGLGQSKKDCVKVKVINNKFLLQLEKLQLKKMNTLIFYV